MNAAYSFRRMGFALLAGLGPVLLSPAPEAAGQTVEPRARVESQLRQVRERADRVREEERDQALSRLEEVRERVEESRLRAAERYRDLQQVVIRTRARLRLGLSFQGQQEEETDRLGVRIEGVMDDSPAREAGLDEGDIITHLNGHSLLDPIPDEGEKEFDEGMSLPVQRLMALARELEPGEEVEIRYQREGRAASVSFQAADLEEPFLALSGWRGEGFPHVFTLDPEDRLRWESDLPHSGVFRLRVPELRGLEELEKLRELGVEVPEMRLRGDQERLIQGLHFGQPGDRAGVWSITSGMRARGLHLVRMNPGLGEYFGTGSGALVLEVSEDSELGLAAGDVILRVGEREVEDPSDVWRILGSYEDGEAVTFTVMRHGGETRVEGKVG